MAQTSMVVTGWLPRTRDKNASVGGSLVLWVRFAPKRIVGHIDAHAECSRRRYFITVEKKPVEQGDGVGNIYAAIVVDIASIQAGEMRVANKERQQNAHGIRDVVAAVTVGVAATKIDRLVPRPDFDHRERRKRVNLGDNLIRCWPNFFCGILPSTVGEVEHPLGEIPGNH